MSSRSWHTMVTAGQVRHERRSSKPITDVPGAQALGAQRLLIAPSACRSNPATIALTPWAMRSGVATAPQRLERV